MFVLVELKDTVRCPPYLFHIKQVEQIRDEINSKLANKVMMDVGLCITMHSIVHVGDSVILHGNGATFTEVIFKYLVFRPELSSIITGKIRSCSREGVHVTLGFFDDVLIPAHLLQYPGRFEETEQAWVWEYPLEDGEKHDLYLDIGESIKFRVVREIFEENSPVGPTKKKDAAGLATNTADAKIPYRILGAINEPGLGVLSWWDQQEKTEEQEEDDEKDQEQEQEQEQEEVEEEEPNDTKTLEAEDTDVELNSAPGSPHKGSTEDLVHEETVIDSDND